MTETAPAGAVSAAERRRVMAVCAYATVAELGQGIAAVSAGTDFTAVRQPELGLVMLRARTGGLIFQEPYGSIIYLKLLGLA